VLKKVGHHETIERALWKFYGVQIGLHEERLAGRCPTKLRIYNQTLYREIDRDNFISGVQKHSGRRPGSATQIENDGSIFFFGFGTNETGHAIDLSGKFGVRQIVERVLIANDHFVRRRAPIKGVVYDKSAAERAALRQVTALACAVSRKRQRRSTGTAQH
jgi:hypothetical protein